MNENKKLTQTAIISFIIAVICLAAMLGMIYASEKSFYSGYFGGMSVSYLIVRILISVLVGIIVFLLPLERIWQKANDAMKYLGSIMTIGKNAAQESQAVFTVIIYAVLCGLSVAFHIHTQPEYANGSGFYGPFGYRSALVYDGIVIVLAFAVIFMGMDIIQTRWRKLLYWELVSLACVTSVYAVTGEHDLVISIICAEFCMYIVYMKSANELKTSTSLVALVCSTVMVLACYADMFTGSRISGNKLLDKKHSIGYVPEEFFEHRYSLTIIKEQFGTAGCVIWFVLFAVFTAAVVVSVVKLIKQSPKRGAFVAGMYAIPAVLLIYTILAELGILAQAETYIFTYETAIPCMILSLRMFFDRDEDRKIDRGNVVNFRRNR